MEGSGSASNQINMQELTAFINSRKKSKSKKMKSDYLAVEKHMPKIGSVKASKVSIKKPDKLTTN